MTQPDRDHFNQARALWESLSPKEREVVFVGALAAMIKKFPGTLGAMMGTVQEYRR